MGQNQKFFRSDFSTFWITEKSDLKNSWICSIWDQSHHLWAQIRPPWLEVSSALQLCQIGTKMDQIVSKWDKSQTFVTTVITNSSSPIWGQSWYLQNALFQLSIISIHIFEYIKTIIIFHNKLISQFIHTTVLFWNLFTIRCCGKILNTSKCYTASYSNKWQWYMLYI